MLKTALLTATAALFVTALATSVHAPAAKAGGLEDALEDLDGFDDYEDKDDDTDCEYVRRRVKVRIWTRYGPRIVWTTRRIRECD